MRGNLCLKSILPQGSHIGKPRRFKNVAGRHVREHRRFFKSRLRVWLSCHLEKKHIAFIHTDCARWTCVHGQTYSHSVWVHRNYEYIPHLSQPPSILIRFVSSSFAAVVHWPPVCFLACLLVWLRWSFFTTPFPRISRAGYNNNNNYYYYYYYYYYYCRYF